MSKKKQEDYDDDSFDEDEYDEDDGWSEMSPERSPDESDEDYDERMSGLYGEDWNFQKKIPDNKSYLDVNAIEGPIWTNTDNKS